MWSFVAKNYTRQDRTSQSLVAVVLALVGCPSRHQSFPQGFAFAWSSAGSVPVWPATALSLLKVHKTYTANWEDLVNAWSISWTCNLSYIGITLPQRLHWRSYATDRRYVDKHKCHRAFGVSTRPTNWFLSDWTVFYELQKIFVEPFKGSRGLDGPRSLKKITRRSFYSSERIRGCR